MTFRKGQIVHHESVIHLFRGAPPVREWSKYQATVTGWTLCGIARKATSKLAEATEDPSLVSCTHCLDLMRSSVKAPRGAAAGF
jgi:hypothetical protein